ncbi:CBS domain-containing protein [Brevibacillus fluminis]|uniref:CBS domain-containing protein n=1 Tax=Brevibacillus fluminis TaxID=511487 RepID=A0A3M8DXH1_9BACL|nr:sigma 54-interacting transcriptional regulator [Brevibacillus fluminis]RNB91687.1 CBS domain-containing protein [Brevibacillus fluminis]
MISVRDIMTPLDKGLLATDTLAQAIELIKRLKWNTVPVTDEEGRPIGAFPKSSLYQMLVEGKELETPISAYIKKGSASTIPVTISYEELEEIVWTSPVGTGTIVDEDGRVVGLITKTDVIFALFHKTRLLKEQLEEILDTSQLGALLTDDNRRIQFVNRRLCALVGKSDAELLHRDLAEFIPLEEREWSNEIHRPLQLGGQQMVIRVCTYETVSGKDGLIALVQPVSEVEKIAEELETAKKWKSLLQTVIDHAYDGLVMINEQQEITFISQSVLELFELDEEKMEAAKIDALLPQLGLSNVMKTGIADVSEFMEVKGIAYIIHRIPVFQGDELIGAVGKIVFRQLKEVRERFRRFEKNEEKDQSATTQLRRSEGARFTFDQIMTQDEQMQKVIRSVTKAAKGPSTILIRGESGTGKELFAHAIHRSSSRNAGPFVTVNCAAIPEHLLESEFFGYEEGAFTGAKQKGKLGKFDLANGGTLFLDEVGDMSLTLQAKLLRVLQEKEFYRVGGTERIHVEVRIIAATHRYLETMVEQGQFREDLFYRLNVISVEIPPLRKRKDDILLLAQFFIQELNKQSGTSITGLEPNVQRLLQEYPWPGNVRELRNVLERAMIFAEHGRIQLEDLPDYLLKKTNADDLGQLHEQPIKLMEQAEQAAIRQALREANGNKTRAAQLLGISRSVLYEKLRRQKTDVR